MTLDRAFTLGDLMLLLGLDLAEPSHQEDITAIENILDRRRADGWSTPPARGDQPGRTLYVVPDLSP